MDISYLLLDNDLAGFVLTIAAQSIIISLSGIAVIKLVSKNSAPVRSLVCTGIIAVLGLALIVSAGFRISGISWSGTSLNAAINNISVLNNHLSSSKIFGADEETGLKPVSTANEIHVLNSHSQPTGLSQSLVKTNLNPVSKGEESDIVPLSKALPGKSDNFGYSHSFLLQPVFISIINSLGIIWFAGVLYLMIRLGHGFFQIYKFQKTLRPISSRFYVEMAHLTSRVFWNSRTPVLYLSQEIESPLAVGLSNPVIVIPEKLFDSLSEYELKSILLHEFSHIYHHDQFIGVIKRIVSALHWWNPIVHMLNRTHEQAREEVSDNYVLSDLHPEVYTRCLANLAEKVCLISNLPTASCMAGKGFNLRSRIENILSQKRRIAMETKLYLKAATVSIGFILTFGAAGLHGKVQSSTDINNPEISSNLTASDQIVDKQILLNETLEKPQKLDVAPETRSAIDRNPSVKEPNKILPEITEVQRQRSIEPASNNIKTVQAVSEDKLKVKNLADIKIENSKKEVQVSAANLEKKIIAKNINKTESSGSDQKQHEKLSNTAREEYFTADDYFSRGKTLLKKGEAEKAVTFFNRALELGKKAAEVYMFRGNAYANIKQQEKAIDDYNKAIELNPDYAEAYNNRGYIFFTKQEYKKAIKDFKKAIKLKPDFYYAYYNRGNTYAAQKKYPKAVSDYSKAIKMNPEFIQAYINRGIRSPKYAVKDFSKALELNSRDAEVYILRGNAYLSKGEYRQAVNDYNKALEIGPESFYVYLQRGNAYSWTKDYNSAISDYSRAIELEPDLSAAYMERSKAYILTNQDAKAANDLKMAANLDPSSFSFKNITGSNLTNFPEVRTNNEQWGNIKYEDARGLWKHFQADHDWAKDLEMPVNWPYSW